MTALMALLLILDLEGLAAFLWAFFTPAESGQAVFLWLSPSRLFLAGLLLLICAALLAASIHLWRSRAAAEDLETRLNAWLVEQGRLAPALLALVVLPLLLVAGILAVLLTPLEYEAYSSLAPDTFPLLHSIVSALLPLLALLVMLMLQSAVFLVTRFRRSVLEPSTWAWHRIDGPLLALLIAAAIAFQWLVLAFRLRFFVNIPAWYWIFDLVPFNVGDLWFILVALSLLVIAYWLLVVQRRTAAGLIVVAALGWFLQMGVGLMGGSGIATLRDRYFTTYHQAYIARAAASDLSVIDSIRQYESLYGSRTFTSTKPPGLMAFYLGLEHLVNGFPSAFSGAVRYERLSNVVIGLLPVLAVCIVALLYAFARRFLDDSSGLVGRLAPLLYVLAPGLALFTFFADQAIYPAVFLLGIWLCVTVIRTRSLAWAFLLGAALYLAAFFAFTMLPLYVFAGLYIVLYHWGNGARLRVLSVVFTALAVAAGTLLMHGLGRALLDYDFLPRFQRTMTINHDFDFYLRLGQQPPGVPEAPAQRLGQILSAAWINNLDYAAAIGFPIYILFLAQSARRARRFFNGGAGGGDIILLALIAAFLILNLAGTAQGEVPRLWLFWLPMLVLLAAYELEPLLRRRPGVLLALGVIQLVTLMLTFHFQDLRM